MHAVTLIVIALLVFALAYRFYAKFIITKALVFDRSVQTPAHVMRDGKDYHPTNRWVLFGHHFAAIAGAGPLVGPVLAAQFGYLPGFLWILIGAVLGGAVHDMVILFASVRAKGQSLSYLAKDHISPLAGGATAIAILFIIILALAGLALVVVNALADSAWATFTIAVTIPAALFVGFYMYKLRPGKLVEASIIGVAIVLAGVVFGEPIAKSQFGTWFVLSKSSLSILLPLYGLVASALPVWMLLCPRDYLSSYMKIGTIAMLAVGICIVNPVIQMPAVTAFVHGGGPIIPGKVWPFVCITIACGAISGFHALISSGTTPKMINSEADIRFISYGSMLTEATVSIMALIAATAMAPGDFFAINLSPTAFATLGMPTDQLHHLESMVGESLVGRSGGAVSLAAGMALILSAIHGMERLMGYWYHFAIMFEALFILTTVDTGTRVARYILQDIVKPVFPRVASPTWFPGVVLTSAVISFLWGYLVFNGDISSIWPMFGVSNQLLATLALSIGTIYILERSGKWLYALTTFVPSVFMFATTFTAGILNITDNYLPRHDFQGNLNSAMTIIMLLLVIIIFGESLRRCARYLRRADVVVPAPDK